MKKQNLNVNWGHKIQLPKLSFLQGVDKLCKCVGDTQTVEFFQFSQTKKIVTCSCTNASFSLFSV